MHIHEYQAKKILKSYGVNIPKGYIAYTPKEAIRVAKKIGGKSWVVKAQVHSGARSKGHFLEKFSKGISGVEIAKSQKQVGEIAEKMLGMNLSTVQTDERGKFVSRVYIEEVSKIASEFYLSMIIDTKTAMVTLMIASEESEDIVTLFENTPEKIMKLPIDSHNGVTEKQIDDIIKFLKMNKRLKTKLTNFINSTYEAYVRNDALMIEINPLVITKKNDVLAIDAKIEFDDNALYRQSNAQRLHDEYEISDRELKAEKNGFRYVSLDGYVGCIVNGDGLALSTMDLIKQNNSKTACYLNVKGGVDKDKMASGIKLIMSDPKVESIIINILAGYNRCNLIAEGILLAAEDLGLTVPIIVRFEGTNKEQATELLKNSGLPIYIYDDIKEAVKVAVEKIEEGF